MRYPTAYGRLLIFHVKVSVWLFADAPLGLLHEWESRNCVWEVRKSHNRFPSLWFCLDQSEAVGVLQRTHTRDYDAPPPHRPAHVCSSMSGEAERSFLLQLQLHLLQTFIPVWVFPSPNMHYMKAFHPFISTLRHPLIFNSRSSIWNTSERTLLIKAQAGPASQ